MSGSVLQARVDLRAASVADTRAFRADLMAKLRGGARLVTLFGRRAGDDALVTAVTQEADGALAVSRASVNVLHGYHELTTDFPALHCFERELHEQTGLRIAGHPWLKPVRFEGEEQAAMNAYPWYQVKGKEVHEVAVGPIHAGIIEPGSFRFMCHGEQVLHLEVHLGYQHRGVEARLRGKDPRTLTPLVETIAGDTSVAHAWASVAGLEALAGVDVSDDAARLRAVMLELERVGMHLAGLSGLATDLGHLQGASTYGRLRTTAINTSLRLSGSRFGRGAVRPGGARVDASPGRWAELKQGVALLQRDLAGINELFTSARSVRHRLAGVGVLTTAQALALGVVGHAARASGVALDARRQAGGLWSAAPIEPVTRRDGDCQARAQVRIAELDASLAWLARRADEAPPRTAAPTPLGPLAPRQLVVSVVEGWRGEVVHAIETDAHGALEHYKVQDPSLRNWLGLAVAVRGNEISDFPVCNKSFDLSYCGNDL